MIAAVMATRFDPPQLAPLLETLRADGVDPIVVRDDGEHPYDWSLYRLWNIGVREAIERGAEYVCVMNDDVTILPGTLNDLAAALWDWPEIGVTYPNVRRSTSDGRDDPMAWIATEGTWGAGAMTGFCFMFRADLDVPFDEKYQLWYGDDDFEERVRAKGLLVARIDGLPIDHTAMGSTSKLGEEVHRWIANDRHLWETRTHYTVQREAITA